MITAETLKQTEDKLIYLRGQRDMAKVECNKILQDSEGMKLELEVLDETNKFFVDALNQKIDEVKHKVEEIINQGLAYVYHSEEVKISISTTFKNNKTQFIITLKDGDIESSKLKESFGGGLIAIISFLFKVVINIIYKNEKFMIFDETLNFVSRHYQEPLSHFIKQLCEKMDVTIVLITHQPLIADKADSVYEAYCTTNGSTKFKHIEKDVRVEENEGELC